MKRVDHKSIRLYKNLLEIKEGDQTSEYLLPINIGFNKKKHDLYKHSNEIYLIEKDLTFDLNKASKVYPPYSFTEIVHIDGVGDAEIEFFLVDNSQDWNAGQQIISQTHYLNPTRKGIMLGCRFREGQIEKQVRKLKRKSIVNNFSSSWTNPTGRIIACSVIDTLNFGSPIGRNKFIPSVSKENWWKKLGVINFNEGLKQKVISRKELVKNLKVAWISRFAIEPPYIGFKLGDLLSKHSLIITSKHAATKFDRVEVIRTLDTQTISKLREGKCDDFLLRANFKIDFENTRYSPPLRDPITMKRVDSLKYRKVYYFKDNINE